MPRQESAGSIREWVDDATRRIDVVASWDSLNETYDALRFSDLLTDAERLEEYKWIVQQMNAFLTRMRTRLLSCKDMEAMSEMLAESFTPTGKVELGSRKALVYQRLRQQWIRMEMTQVREMLREQEEQGGWTDYGDE